MARVVHFEIAAEDPARAQAFYSDVLGWSFYKWEGPVDYWLVTTGPDDEPGINGAIMQPQPNWPQLVNTIDVADLDATLGKVEAAGGMILQPRMAVPGVGYMAYCQDTEGVIFGLMQADEGAVESE